MRCSVWVVAFGFVVLAGGCGSSSTSQSTDGQTTDQQANDSVSQDGDPVDAGVDEGVDAAVPDSVGDDAGNDATQSDALADSLIDGLPPDGQTPDGSTDGIGPALTCLTVSPEAGYNVQAATLTLTGQGFDAGAQATLTDLIGGGTTSLPITSVSDADGDGVNDTAEFEVPAATPQGLYDVSISNPDGATAVCGSYTSTAAAPPTLTEVTPATAWQGDPVDQILSDEPISLKGTGFQAVPSVRFVSLTTNKVYYASNVGFIDATSLSSICPSESLAMPVGDYYVEVVNPSKLWARWIASGGQDGIFRVTSVPPPRIDAVSPFRIPVNAGGGVPVASVTITGEHFDAAAQVIVLQPAGGTVDLTASITAVNVDPAGVDTIELSIDNTSVGLDLGIYPLRLINPDGQYDTYFSLQIEHAAPGKLNAASWATVSDLQVPRERHASVAGFDAFGGSHIYTIGGTSVPASGDLTTRPRPVVDSTEITSVDVFGVASNESAITMQLDPTVAVATIDPKHDAVRAANRLTSARTGLTAVRAGRHIYAIGGASADSWYPAVDGQVAALDTVERARILGYETRPNLSLPQVKAASKGLPFGTWYYRVSAISAEGESLPSREVVALNSRGVATLSWLPVTGATSYFVYRSLASDGRAGSTRLIAANVTATSFVDDGQNSLTPAPGRLRGKLAVGGSLAVGSWSYRVTAAVAGQSETLAGYRATLATEAGSQSVVLAWDSIPNASFNVYRTAAVDAAGDAPCYLIAAGLTAPTFTDDGAASVDQSKSAPEGTPPLPAGTLSWWTELPDKLAVPREGADAVLVRASDGDPVTDDPYYVFLVGGRQDNATDTTYLVSVERALLDTQSAALGPWALQAGSDLNTARAFFPLLTTQGRNTAVVAPPPEVPPCPDNDADGYTDCFCGGDDCNDADPSIHPGAPEICGDGIDQDCDAGCSDGADLACDDCTTPDADNDGVARPDCGGDDCDDADASIHPGAEEICGDGIDQDCNGSDLLCNCPTPDGDGDGFDSVACGGDDCNDEDETICPDASLCPDIACDGVDQDCDGIDPCAPTDVFLVAANPPVVAVDLPELPDRTFGTPRPLTGALEIASPVCTSVPPFAAETAALYGLPQEEAPAYLVVLYGDESYSHPGKNQGLQTAEVALVRTDGTLSAWVVQDSAIVGNYRYGNDGLLYHDFAFSFLGVLVENLGKDPQQGQIWNNVYRYQIDTVSSETWVDPPPATFLYDLNPAASYLDVPRVYLGVVRLNAFIFAVAGNGGDNVGPVSSIERIKQ